MSALKENIDAAMKPLAASANSPNWQKSILVYDGTSTNSISYVAPADGFVTQHINGYPNAGYNDITISDDIRPFICRVEESSGTVRIRKGDSVTFNALSFGSVVQRVVKFYYLVGGGHKALRKLLQSGGESCLRLKKTRGRFSNSAVGNPSQQMRSSILAFHSLMGCISVTQPQAMDTSVSKSLMRDQCQQSKFDREICTNATTGSTQVTGALGSPSRKAKQFNRSSAMDRQEIVSRFLFRQLALPNLSANWEEVRHAA